MSRAVARTDMRFGLGLAQLGRFADPQTTARFAIRAENLGFSSLWTIDRLLSPMQPRSAYPATPDGALPPEQHRVMDPLITLTVAAGVTERIRLGTNVLVAPWYPPVLLARSLATLDCVSAGRLNIGLGIGWSVDEYEAVGAPMRRRGERLDEVIDVMTSFWQGRTGELATSRESIAPAYSVITPMQSPRPPILLAAYTPTGLDRVARLADGWIPTGLPIDAIAAMWSTVLSTAERNGRDQTRLQLVVRADPKIGPVTLGRDRAAFTGSWDQVVDDIGRVADIGASELILDLQSSAEDPDDLIGTAARLVAAVAPDILAAP